MQQPLSNDARWKRIVRALLAWFWRRRIYTGPGALVLLIAAALLALRPGSDRDIQDVVYQVRKMDLVINVLAGGNLAAAGSLEIKSKVEGQTKIISVVPEGTILTEEDVKNGKLIMELDSAELREKATQQEITVQSSKASLTQAQETFQIQKNQNESNIKAAELRLKFARMDLERYLGASLAQRLLQDKTTTVNLVGQTENEQEAAAAIQKLGLGGSAQQEWRKLQAAIDLAGEEVSRAASSYEWSKRLGPKELGGAGYITRSDVEADALALKRRQMDLEQAKLALQIFLQYDFPKQVEKLLSDYQEAQKELEREQARARAELAKAEADLKSKEATYALQKERLDKLNSQIANCLIRAPKPGMVVYPTTAAPWRGGAQDKIEEGATVRERQLLLTIPDSTSMIVSAKVHETEVNKVKPGQKARIVPDGFPDRELVGMVQKVARMADPANPWLSPDLRVYDTTITVDNPPPELKPGMSVQVEIIVDRLQDVIAVPLQAVSTVNGKRVCYLVKDGRTEARVVETGQFNDNFIEVKSGLAVGENVLLRAPVAIGPTASPPAPKEEERPVAEAPKSPASNNASPPAEPPATSPSSGKVESLPAGLINRLPEERREALRKEWESATPEQRQEMLKRLQERRRPRHEGQEEL